MGLLLANSEESEMADLIVLILTLLLP